mgnify:CR=1 FL=1
MIGSATEPSHYWRPLINYWMRQSESQTLPRNYIVLLYKSVRELLMNVVKHAKVPVATVWMRMTVTKWCRSR